MNLPLRASLNSPTSDALCVHKLLVVALFSSSLAHCSSDLLSGKASAPRSLIFMRQWRVSTKQRFDELPCVWLHSLYTFETFPFEMASSSTISVMLRRALQTPTIMPFSCSVSSSSRTTLSNPFTCKASVKMELLFHAAVYVETLLKKRTGELTSSAEADFMSGLFVSVSSSVNAVCLCWACAMLTSVTAFKTFDHFLPAILTRSVWNSFFGAGSIAQFCRLTW